LIYKIPITAYSPEPIYTLQGPTSEITWLDFSSDGSNGNWLLASSGSKVYLWNMMRPTDKPVTLQRHKDNLVYASFTNDSEWIITLSTNHTLQFWSMDLEQVSSTACKYAGRNLSRAEWERYFPDSDSGEFQETCSGFSYGLEQEETNIISGPTPTPKPTLAFIQPPTMTPTPTEIFTEYIVQSGDTLYLIAAKLNIDYNTLIADNNDHRSKPDCDRTSFKDQDDKHASIAIVHYTNNHSGSSKCLAFPFSPTTMYRRAGSYIAEASSN